MVIVEEIRCKLSGEFYTGVLDVERIHSFVLGGFYDHARQ